MKNKNNELIVTFKYSEKLKRIEKNSCNFNNYYLKLH